MSHLILPTVICLFAAITQAPAAPAGQTSDRSASVSAPDSRLLPNGPKGMLFKDMELGQIAHRSAR